MDEAFHASTQIDKAAMQALLARRDDRPALLRFGAQYTLLLGSVALLASLPVLALPDGFKTILLVLSLLVFALMTMAMFAIVHETGHNTAFGSRRLNRLVCWLAALPIYYVPTGFREFHFAHHRHTHDPARDPELAIGGRVSPGPGSSLPFYLFFISGQPLLLYKIALVLAGALGGPAALRRSLLFYVSPRNLPRLVLESRLVVLFHLLLLILALTVLPGLLWLIPAQMLGHMLLSCYLISEHTGRPHQGSILERTRTTLTTGPLRWLMWNMPYHAEHHAYPAVPWHALPALHARLAPEMPQLSPGYLNFHQRALDSLLRGRAFQEIAEREAKGEMV